MFRVDLQTVSCFQCPHPKLETAEAEDSVIVCLDPHVVGLNVGLGPAPSSPVVVGVSSLLAFNQDIRYKYCNPVTIL